MIVPSSIDATGRTDVTAQLNAWLASLTDPYVAEFPAGAVYRVDGTVTVTKRAYPTLVGGAKLVAVTDGTELGTKARTRSQLALVGCTSPVVRGLEIQGANPLGGTDLAGHVIALEAQHCVTVDTSPNAELDGLNLHDPYGDCIYGRSDGLWVHGCAMHRTGRNALGIVNGRNVRIRQNTIGEINQHVVDFETGASHSWRVDGVDLSENCIGTHRLRFVAARGSYSTVSNVDVRGNQLYSPIDVDVSAGIDYRYQNWKVRDNLSTFVRESTAALMTFGRVDGLIVVNNRESLRGTSVAHPIVTNACTGTLLVPNDWS